MRTIQHGFWGLAAAALLSTAPAQAVTTGQANLNVPGHLQLSVTGGCSNRGSSITLGPEITFTGIPAKVVFDGGGDHDAEAEDTVDVTLDLGGTITMPKQGARTNGVTGNPKISVYINGALIVGPIRCNKL